MVGWFTDICDMFIKFVGTGWFHWLIAAIILVAGSVKNTHFRHKFLYPAAMILIVFFCPLVYGTISWRSGSLKVLTKDGCVRCTEVYRLR